MVANIDITPTVLEAAGITPEGASFDGRSLLDESWSRDRLLLEFFGPERETIVPPWASLRTSDYQYVEYYDGAGEVTFREYYDLAQDRWQLENLLGDGDASNDPSVTELHDRLAADRACAGSSCP
jgi:arylsulfatase A-like enzyme